jgi:hypothetical protein
MRQVFGIGMMALLAGCSDTIETYEPGMDWEQVVAEGLDAPPQDIELEIRDLGMTLLGAISNAPASKRVWVIEGIPGDGACPARLRGACMSLVEPVPIYSAVTSPDGEAFWSRVNLHPGSFEYAFQVVVVNPNDEALLSDVTYPIL